MKGLLGALALGIPLFASFGQLLWTARRSVLQRSGLAMVLVMILYSFGENLEILAYLYWPALIVMGQALAGPALQSGDAAKE